jgi:hypothetical protein
MGYDLGKIVNKIARHAEMIALFEFEEGDNGVGIASEKHYKLVSPEEVTESDLDTYRARTAES